MGADKILLRPVGIDTEIGAQIAVSPGFDGGGAAGQIDRDAVGDLMGENGANALS